MLFDFLSEIEQEQITKHLSSFLKWVSINNPDFHTSLTREELTTCWLNDFVHPTWVNDWIEKGDIRFIAHLNEYFEMYHSEAHLFDAAVQPTLRAEPQEEKQKKPEKPAVKKHEPLTSAQFKKLLPLVKKHKRRVYVKSLTKQEASALISELLALEA